MRKYIYIWLPAALTVYLLILFFMFKDNMISEGKTLQLYLTLGAELLIIIALSYFLKKRTDARLRREEEEKRKG